jgi:hypothetical protein
MRQLYEVPCVGICERENAAWTFLVTLKIRQGKELVQISLDELKPGQTGYAEFSCGVGSTHCTIRRLC